MPSASPQTALIFGASGQDGGYLEQLLCQKGLKVVSTSRRDLQNRCDVGDFSQVQTIVQHYRPDYLFHLAANSSSRHEATFENQRSIVDGSLNVLEAVKLHSPQARVFLSGSALQFFNSGEPIDEFSQFEASSSYSAQRIASVYMARYFRDKHGLRTYIGYFFHHDSPRRGPHHVAQKIAQAAIRIASGEKILLELDNIGVRKEWTFAGDAMEAVWLLVNQENHFEAVIGSGKLHSVREWGELCFQMCGLNWEEHLAQSRKFKSESPSFVSNPARLFSMGWRTKTSFHDLARLMTEKTGPHPLL